MGIRPSRGSRIYKVLTGRNLPSQALKVFRWEPRWTGRPEEQTVNFARKDGSCALVSALPVGEFRYFPQRPSEDRPSASTACPRRALEELTPCGILRGGSLVCANVVTRPLCLRAATPPPVRLLPFDLSLL